MTRRLHLHTWHNVGDSHLSCNWTATATWDCTYYNRYTGYGLPMFLREIPAFTNVSIEAIKIQSYIAGDIARTLHRYLTDIFIFDIRYVIPVLIIMKMDKSMELKKVYLVTSSKQTRQLVLQWLTFLRLTCSRHKTCMMNTTLRISTF